MDRLKLQISNFAGGLRVRDSKQEMDEKARSHDVLLICVRPIIYGKAKVTNFKFCRRIQGKGY